jgi:TRAP-type C4-dicarboxylate transport system substrate-binding protein
MNISESSLRAADLSVADIMQQTSVAQDWLAGRYAAAAAEGVLYTGEPLPFTVTGHPPENAAAVVDVIKPAIRVLESMSNGKIRVDDFWGATRHRDRDGVAALNDGRSDLAPIYSGWDAKSYPLAQGLQLPGLFPHSDVGTLVSEEIYFDYLREDVERQGIKMGRLKMSGPYHLFSMQPIRSRDDLKGLRIGTTEGIEAEFMLALGAQPVPLSSLEMNPALAGGKIDAMHLADGSSEVFGIGKIARFRTALGFVRQCLEFGLSQRFWSKLPQGLKHIVHNWLRAEAQAETQIFYGVAGAKARDRFAERGMTMIYMSDAEYGRVADAVQPIVARFVATEEAAGRPARAMLKDIEARTAAHCNKTANDLMMEAIVNPVARINE